MKRSIYIENQSFWGCTFLYEEERKIFENGYSTRMGRFRCKCGNEFSCSIKAVKRGNTKSCGCFAKESRLNNSLKHGQAKGGKKSSEYNTWMQMRKRCGDKNYKEFHLYGGRGIRVCKRWEIFENFYEDMGSKPSKIHSIDRINNNGNYYKENCVWATKKEQANNRRNNLNIRYNNEVRTLKQWCEYLNISYSKVFYRYKKCKWPINEIFTNSEIRGKVE